LFRFWTKVGQWIGSSGLCWSLSIGLSSHLASAQQSSGQVLTTAATPLGQVCPSTLPTLIDRMLLDLPSYINRVRISAGIRRSYVLLAARPEFEPLPLSRFSTLPSDTQSGTSSVKQIFFTTLMRRYDSGRITNLQEYHWLFLAQPPKEWQFVMLYSTIGAYPAKADQPPLPPRNSSDASVAVAIKTWLNDCRSGTLQPIQNSLKREKRKQR
jgi:hypothetical protein